MNETDEFARTDRRRFLMLMGLACASTAIVHPAVVLAAPARGVAPPPAPAELPKEPSAEAVAIARLIELRHHDHLTTAQLGVIARDLDVRLEAGRELARQRLANADEPDATFRA